jgi:hypothetical protein
MNHVPRIKIAISGIENFKNLDIGHIALYKISILRRPQFVHNYQLPSLRSYLLSLAENARCQEDFWHREPEDPLGQRL